jgi:hypothetical protein
VNLHPRTANGGWLGIASGALLLVSAAMLSAPGADGPASEISTYFADSRAVVLLSQAVGLAAAVLFLAFALRFALAATPGPADPDRWRLVWSSGVLVFAAAVVASLPTILLALTSDANAASSWTRPLALLADGTDAALFLTIALFLAAAATQGTRAPAWLRASAAIGALLAIARSIAGLVQVTSVLEAVAPLAFIAVVLAASVWMLWPGPPQKVDQGPGGDGRGPGGGPGGPGDGWGS